MNDKIEVGGTFPFDAEIDGVMIKVKTMDYDNGIVNVDFDVMEDEKNPYPKGYEKDLDAGIEKWVIDLFTEMAKMHKEESE